MTTSYRPDRRKIELLVLVAVFLIILGGLTLVYLGKRASTPLPSDALSINTATATELKQALGIDSTTAQALVAERSAQRGHKFASVYAMMHSKTLKPISLGEIETEHLIARTPSAVFKSFWGGALGFFVAFIIAHLALRRLARDADSFVLPLVALLSGFGLMLVYTVKDPYRDTFSFLGQVWGTAIYGVLVMLIPLTKPFGKLILRRYQYIYAIGAVVLMVLLILVGHGPGGIHIRLFGFEPVEIIKLLMVLFVVSYLIERRGALGSKLGAVPRRQDFLPLAVLYAFALLLFVVVKDLGPAVLLFGTFLGILYLDTQRKLYPFLGILLLTAAGFAGYAAHLGFFQTRVMMWLNPWANTDPKGAQLAQGLWGMATGGVFGSGLGLGQPGRMPRAGSDLIFATLGEELGLIGTISVLIVFVLLITRGFRIALRAQTDFDRLLAAGFTLLLALQTIIIVGGVTGFIPLTGITLPFISYGASSLVADFFAIGMLLQLSNKLLPTTVADRATPEWTRAARTVAVGCAVILLLGIGVGRLFVVQGVQDSYLATRSLYTPDADKVSRPHINPRLLSYASHIPRGQILDRNGLVLARDAAQSSESGATNLLTQESRKRVYPYGESCAHLMADIEAPETANPLGHNASLRGFQTYADLLPWVRGTTMPWEHAPHGQDITLSIDAKLQKATSDALIKTASSIRDRKTGKPKDRGAAVAIDAATGEVLASVSIPTFNPATLTEQEWADLNAGKDGKSTLLDRATQGLYPPGSVFKIVTATSAFQNQVNDKIFNCVHTEYNWRWRYGGKPYSRRQITDEAGFVPHGSTDLSKALRVSCNVYFAHMGLTLGADALSKTARQDFGLQHMPNAAKTGEDLPDCAYGQGADLVTPLEMARVVQTVANNGQMLPAVFIKQGSGDRSQGTRVLEPGLDGQLQQMLAGVTTDGTARGVFDGLSVSVAGKTGSAQADQTSMTHSWFAGFAPAVRPTIAFACVIEYAGAGRSGAAPVCREIVKTAFE